MHSSTDFLVIKVDLRTIQRKISMKSPRILVVEDKAIIALDIMRFLISKGYKDTRYYLNGEDALKAIKKEKPDIAILDVILHGEISGIEIAEELRRLSVPFIFVSALSNPIHQQAVLNLNPAAVFLKPVNLNEVLAIVQKVLTIEKVKDMRISTFLN